MEGYNKRLETACYQYGSSILKSEVEWYNVEDDEALGTTNLKILFPMVWTRTRTRLD